MFSIDCAPLSEFDDYEDLLTALEFAKDSLSREAPVKRPSYQFDYREVGLETVDEVLGYADIAGTNTPLGVVGSFEPIAEEGEWVVFPLSGLREHLENVAPEAVVAFNEFGSLDRAVSSRPSLTPGDQLAIAVLECLDFCQKSRLVLAFAW